MLFEPYVSEFYGDLVYKFKKLIGRNDFAFRFRKIITHYALQTYRILLKRYATVCMLSFLPNHG